MVGEEKRAKLAALWAEAETAFRVDPAFAIEVAEAASAALRGVRGPVPAAVAFRERHEAAAAQLGT